MIQIFVGIFNFMAAILMIYFMGFGIYRKFELRYIILQGFLAVINILLGILMVTL